MSVATHAYLSSMRLTYAVGVSVIIVAMIVAYRYLPARAHPVADTLPSDAHGFRTRGRAEPAPIAVTGPVE